MSQNIQTVVGEQHRGGANFNLVQSLHVSFCHGLGNFLAFKYARNLVFVDQIWIKT